MNQKGDILAKGAVKLEVHASKGVAGDLETIAGRFE
jgi:hypothetical protein